MRTERSLLACRAGINLSTIREMRKEAILFMRSRQAEHRIPEGTLAFDMPNMTGLVPIQRVIVIDDSVQRVSDIRFALISVFRPQALDIPHRFYSLPMDFLGVDSGFLPVFIARNESGFEGVEFLTNYGEVSLVLMDYHIPGEATGASLTEAFRIRNPADIIVAITNDEDGREEILAAGGTCAVRTGQSFWPVFCRIFVGIPRR